MSIVIYFPSSVFPFDPGFFEIEDGREFVVRCLVGKKANKFNAPFSFWLENFRLLELSHLARKARMLI